MRELIHSGPVTFKTMIDLDQACIIIVQELLVKRLTTGGSKKPPRKLGMPPQSNVLGQVAHFPTTHLYHIQKVNSYSSDFCRHPSMEEIKIPVIVTVAQNQATRPQMIREHLVYSSTSTRRSYDLIEHFTIPRSEYRTEVQPDLASVLLVHGRV